MPLGRLKGAMLDSFLNIDIVQGPVIITAFVLAAGAFLYLLVRKPTSKWAVTAAIALLTGSLVALAVVWLVVDVFDAFGMQLGFEVTAWTMATFSGICLAVLNLWNSRWWRKSIAGVGILVFALAGTLGVNAYFGLNRTIGSFINVSTAERLDIAAQKPSTEPTVASPSPSPSPVVPVVEQPFWERWVSPANMPTKGRTGTEIIPNPKSGFKARPAGIYLPPAALVENPPALPLVIMMMGQPGTPDPEFAAGVLNWFASQHKGLAPIVIVADQLGSPYVDPACTDSVKYGKVETYITQDVVDWAVTHFNIIRDRQAWTLIGYSNGGACALTYATKYPAVWGNVLDISGEEYPGYGNPAKVLRDVFQGDHAAYDAQKPINIMAKTTYNNLAAVFTVGSNDPGYIVQAKRMLAATQAAGITSSYVEIPNGGHVFGALNGGLEQGFDILYPRLGLAPPRG
jgi:enterochelin esterase-like enzyme